MTSPVHDFEPFEDEAELLGDMSQADEIEEEGEELFGDNMEKYALLLTHNSLLIILIVSVIIVQCLHWIVTIHKY